MEDWKTIEEFPEYEVSSLGRVRGPKSSDLRGATNQGGYRTVSLCKDKKVYRKLVHRLVGLAFLPPVADKMMIDHINRDRTDNRLDNLRWVNNSENQLNSSRSKEPYIYMSFRVAVPGAREKRFKTLEEALLYRDSLLS